MYYGIKIDKTAQKPVFSVILAVLPALSRRLHIYVYSVIYYKIFQKPKKN